MRIKPLELLLFAVMLTASFDIFLNIKIAGFSLRVCNILQILAISYCWGMKLHRGNAKLRFIGLLFFLIWLGFNILFIPNTTIIGRNLGYLFFFVINFLFAATVIETVYTEDKLVRAMKFYILSFGLLALMGILQFFLGIVGIDFFVEQWWIKGVLPRANGFSYEPSYYSTYLNLGIGFILILIYRGHYLFKKFQLYSVLILLFTANIISSSRMGIGLMFAMLMTIYISDVTSRIFRGTIRKQNIYYAVIVISILFVGFRKLNYRDVEPFFHGLGLMGGAAHSTGARWNAALQTFAVFMDSPIIGVSFGGIPTGRAEQVGVIIRSQGEAKSYEGMNIFFETLASSGVFGFVFFLIWLVSLYRKTLKIPSTRTVNETPFRLLGGALLFSLTFVLLLLSLNQNIIRNYLWVHIGMINAVYFVSLSRSTTHVTERESPNDKI